MEAELALRTEAGRNDYRFALAHAHTDRFVFTDEAFRFSSTGFPADVPWQHAPGGQSEAAIVDIAQGPPSQGVNATTARVIVHLLRSCSVYQFHDTSETSNFKKQWDVWRTTTTCVRTAGTSPPYCIGWSRKTYGGSS